ncbi:MAG: CBS and ACT domain-containing protein [Bilophila sp.]
MLIREWMTGDVITVTPETSMLKASKLMKDHGIRRLPVVDDSKHVIGIVSDRDVKAASPSKATTLDMHELYYLLSEVKIKDIMTQKPFTIRDNETVEMAAVLMEEKNFGGLPVVNAENILVGIITDHDIFKVLIDISGAREGGIQLAFLLPDKTGILCPVFDSLREFGANVLSVLTSRSKSQCGSSHVYIRLHPMDADKEKALLEYMKKSMPLEYWVDDEMHPL